MPRPVRKGKNWPYRSGLEVKMAAFMDSKGIAYEYEVDTFKIATEIPKVYCGVCSGKRILQDTVYTPDFRVLSGDKRAYIEGKGRLTAKEKRRIAALLRDHPTIDFRLVFMRNNPIYPRSKTKYMDWAAAEKIPACIGPELPDEWVREFSGTKPKRKRRVKT
jgi:hypothetical protein